MTRDPRAEGNRIPSAILSSVKGSRYSPETMRLTRSEDFPKMSLGDWCKRVAEGLGTAQDCILYLDRKLQIGISERIRCEINERRERRYK